MASTLKEPTYNRLNIAFKALGPYLREEQFQEDTYMFDCLAVCIDDKKSPEKREFWGWFMYLKQTDRVFEASYAVGRYDLSGNWLTEAPPSSAMAEIRRTQESFHQKLDELLNKTFGSQLKSSEDVEV